MRGVKPIYQLCDYKWIVNWSVNVEDSCVFRNKTMTGSHFEILPKNSYRKQPMHNKYVITMI